jgi:hypothetical protein
LSEDDFWRRLEVRVRQELAGMRDPALRWLGCDGFEPWRYFNDDDNPRVEGRAWFLEGPKQTEWRFTLFLPRRFGSRDDIPWASLLPAEDVTRWLALDRAGKQIQIEPAVSVPDPA